MTTRVLSHFGACLPLQNTKELGREGFLRKWITKCWERKRVRWQRDVRSLQNNRLRLSAVFLFDIIIVIFPKTFRQGFTLSRSESFLYNSPQVRKSYTYTLIIKSSLFYVYLSKKVEQNTYSPKRFYSERSLVLPIIKSIIRDLVSASLKSLTWQDLECKSRREENLEEKNKARKNKEVSSDNAL